MTITDTNNTNDTSEGTAVDAVVRPDELRRLLADDPQTRILDVRTGGEFASVHIPGSFNVPLSTLSEQVRDVARIGHPVVLVCQSGARAATAQETLNAAGKSNLRVLQGGIGGWIDSGGEVVRGDEKWAMDRQVRAVAGGITIASIVASIGYPKLRFVAGAIGVGLFVSAVTNTCTLGNLLAKLPYNRGPKCDLDCVLSEIAADRPTTP
jgi:rhodanese-related sulfurtransferase